jgi:hypothetical protein
MPSSEHDNKPNVPPGHEHGDIPIEINKKPYKALRPER